MTGGLRLPESIRVRWDRKDATRVTERVRAWIEADVRRGIHASDLLYPRISFWKVVDPQPLTTRQVWIFAVGRALHVIHNEACGGSGTDEGSEWSEDLGIWFSPDHIEDDGEIVELKTTRAYVVAQNIEDIEDYLRQLAIYMVARRRLRGKLRVLYINHREEDRSTSPRLVTVTLVWDESALAEYREAIIHVRHEVDAARAAQDHRRLPLCPEWMCGAMKCPWWDKCKPEGRWCCSTHPRYRGKRPPKVPCAGCAAVFTARSGKEAA